MIKENAETQVKGYIKSVNNLYNDVEAWAKSLSLSITRKETQIIEEDSGNYKIDKLIVKDNLGNIVVELIPIGAFIIGGNGRVDLVGTIDKVIFINLGANGSSITRKSLNINSETLNNTFYKNIDKQGWYWIENSRRGKASFLDKNLFFELLWEVSDYEAGKSS